MITQIPQNIVEIYKKIQETGYKVYLVGGCVRNLIMQKDVKDWDMTTNAKPEDILKLFKNAFYDNKFGTVGIPVSPTIEQSNNRTMFPTVIEITTFRTEHGYSDQRRPDIVKWGKSIEEDLSRRDFTINAIAMKLSTLNSQLSASIIDPYDGQKDIEQKIIRAVGNPSQRFKEDALRLLRAIRIATELNFTIEENTFEELKKDACLITKVSGERVREEFLRILSNDNAYQGVILLKESQLLQNIIPELFEGVDVSQARPGRHHTTDVFTHNLLSLKFTPSKDPIVKLAALLHDIAKPKVQSVDEKGLVIFHNHEIVGAKMTRDITERLKLSKKDRERIVNLIRWHMFTVDEKITDAAIRRFIRRVGVNNVKDMMDLRIGDRLGGGTQRAESWRLKLFKKRIEDQLKPGPFSLNDLAVDGNDVMRELNIKPGKKVGEILQKLFEEVDEDLSKNNREYLLKRTHELP